MGKEIEAKMKVGDLSVVRRKLGALGATRRGADRETNTFFDTPGHTLQSADQGLRIRVVVDESGNTRCLVTMKGPLKGKFKTRQEIQYSADDAGQVRAMFEALGYSATLSFEKRRETWDFAGCEVAPDELPFLGTYVEIEGEGENVVSAARESLGLAELPLISTGYISLLSKYLQDQ